MQMNDEGIKTIVYWDCPTGISGDMCLGALLDVGVPLTVLTDELAKLGLDATYQLEVASVKRCGQAATQARVSLTAANQGEAAPTSDAQAADHRHLPEIERLIMAANLSPRVQTWSLAIFRKLAEAEGVVHGIPPSQVHFHEVGATDALVDIIGTCIGLDWLGMDALYCSALPTGNGTVRAAHGILPVPAPAVLTLLAAAQVPIYSNGIDQELVTPTGAAIATTLATGFGAPPPFTLQKVGLGAGSRTLAIPNILRLWVGTSSAPEVSRGDLAATGEREPLIELQTQLDDINPQAIGYVYEKLLAAGAWDVFSQSISMKKNRPGILLTVLCSPTLAEECETILFDETSTLGVRRTAQQRQTLQRDWVTLELAEGPIRIKIGRRPNESAIINLQPEYEDCAQLARSLQIPWKQVYQKALSAAYSQLMVTVPPSSDSPAPH